MTQEQRFWDKVNVGGSKDCWVWTGCKRPGGYGQIRYDRRIQKSHRVSWKINCGDIPEGLCVLHKCDNPSCVNPNHLWLGTYQDNSTDMVNKERQSKGENLPQSKITQVYADCIRTAYANGDATYRQLAKEFNISRSTIWYIVTNQTWR